MTAGSTGRRIGVPDALAASHRGFFGDRGSAWIAALPALAADRVDCWELRPDGPPAHGAVALVLPVLRGDGTPAALKLQPVDEETRGEPVALRAWAGHGAVALLEHDPDSGSVLLERLDAGRPLSAVPDSLAATRTLAELLARLNAVPAPRGMRHLADIATAMLARVPDTLPLLSDPSERRLVGRCAGAVRELLGEPGDRLLHWDLHYDNVLAAYPSGGPEPWRVIDPKPLAGDPGFELLPALRNRWDEIAAAPDVRRAVRRRFDLMAEVLGLDRRRATGWTLGRLLQNALWETEGGRAVLDPALTAITRALLD